MFVIKQEYTINFGANVTQIFILPQKMAIETAETKYCVYNNNNNKNNYSY